MQFTFYRIRSSGISPLSLTSSKSNCRHCLLLTMRRRIPEEIVLKIIACGFEQSNGWAVHSSTHFLARHSGHVVSTIPLLTNQLSFVVSFGVDTDTLACKVRAPFRWFRSPAHEHLPYVTHDTWYDVRATLAFWTNGAITAHFHFFFAHIKGMAVLIDGNDRQRSRMKRGKKSTLATLHVKTLNGSWYEQNAHLMNGFHRHTVAVCQFSPKNCVCFQMYNITRQRSLESFMDFSSRAAHSSSRYFIHYLLLWNSLSWAMKNEYEKYAGKWSIDSCWGFLVCC